MLVKRVQSISHKFLLINEAWKDMRASSYTDFILTKINRTKEIESNNESTLISEGINANYMDMINYAVFGLIKLEFGD